MTGSGWITPLALVAMSLPFFSVAIAPFVDTLLWSAGVPPGVTIFLSSVLWNFSLPGLIALCGGCVFLVHTQKENPSWYLGIPLVVSCALIAVSPFLGQFLIVHDPNPPLYDPGVLCSILSSYGAIAVLPPCAALFFWSERRLGSRMAAMAGIAVVVTLNSLIVMAYVLSPYLVTAGLLPPAQPHSAGQPVAADGGGELFLILGYLLGLPLIGICLLVLAILLWRNGRPAATLPPPSLTSF